MPYKLVPNPKKLHFVLSLLWGGRATSSWPPGLLSIFHSFAHSPSISNTEFLCKLSFYMAIVFCCVGAFHSHYHNAIGASLRRYLASASLSFKLWCCKSEHGACCCRRVVFTVEYSVLRFICPHRHFTM